VRGPDGPIRAYAERSFDQLFQRDDQDKLRAMQKRMDHLNATHPGSPARGDGAGGFARTGDAARVSARDAGSPGDAVPREFLTVLSPDNRQPFKQGSGRLELAQAIASRDNPLTARVMVNRVWLHHFGAGLVRTPSEFGARGEPPTHPELLD